MNIRTATLDDLQAVTAVEAACFPAAEAASEERMRDRISHFGDHFGFFLTMTEPSFLSSTAWLRGKAI